MKKRENNPLKAIEEVLTIALVENPDLKNSLEQRVIEKRKSVEERKNLKNKSI